MEMEQPTVQEELDDLTRFAATVRTQIHLPKNERFTRAEVVQAFASTFELIGGVPRLALWAHRNESEFYKLYAKLLPSAQIIDINARVTHAIEELTTEELEAIVIEGTSAHVTDS